MTAATKNANGVALPAKPPYTRWIVWKELTPHPVIERDLDVPRADEIAKHYNRALLGVITVSQHKSTLWIVDGMHRQAGALRAGRGDEAAECHVFENLTLAQEAALFRGRNNSKHLHPMDLFRAAVHAEDPLAVACNTLIEKLGWKVARSNANGFAAVAALTTAYRRDPVATERALTTLQRAWGATKHSGQAPLVHGLSLFFERYGDLVDLADLARKLAKLGEPGTLVGRAKAYAEIKSMRVGPALAAITVDVYNLKRPKKIENW